MRIERLQHAVDRAVDQPVRRHLLDVLAIDRRERRGEDAILLRKLVLRRDDAAAEDAAEDRPTASTGKERPQWKTEDSA